MKLIKDLSQLLEQHANLNEDASELEVGDPVEINVSGSHEGKTGSISRFDSDDKNFAVVDFDSGGSSSFHVADLVKIDDEDGDDEDNFGDKFYVAFYDEDENTSWIGKVYKDGGKWHEERYRGEPDYKWGGGRYMSYLTPADVMSWIHKDYSRHMEVEGPFNTPQEAEEYIRENWAHGEVHEGMSYVSLEKAVAATIERMPLALLNQSEKEVIRQVAQKVHEKNPGAKLDTITQIVAYKLKASKAKVSEAFKLKDKVKIIGGPKDVRGKEGHIAEIRTDVGGAKKYTIDYEVGGRTTSVMLKASDLRTVKE